jgi:hypothetical protein
MINDSIDVKDNEYINNTRQRVKEKIEDYNNTEHEIKVLKLKNERTKEYIDLLNSFLEHEGQRPEQIETRPHGITAKFVGNRKKGLPLRKDKWLEVSINKAVQTILSESPNRIYKPHELAKEIYEINSDADLRMVIKNFSAMLQRGERDHLWIRPGRAQYKARLSNQGQLTNV